VFSSEFVLFHLFKTFLQMSYYCFFPFSKYRCCSCRVTQNSFFFIETYDLIHYTPILFLISYIFMRTCKSLLPGTTFVQLTQKELPFYPYLKHRLPVLLPCVILCLDVFLLLLISLYCAVMYILAHTVGK